MDLIHCSEIQEEECYEISLKHSSGFGLKKELCFLSPEDLAKFLLVVKEERDSFVHQIESRANRVLVKY